MAGFLSRLFRRVRKRPIITQEESADAEKLNEVVDWFLTYEDLVRRRVSFYLQTLTLLGYTNSRTDPSIDEPCVSDDIEFQGLRNRMTFEIWRRLAGICMPTGEIQESKMKTLLQGYDDDLRQTVLHLRECDTTGSELEELLSLAEPILSDYIRTLSPFDCVTEYRNRLEREVFNEPRRRHLAAIFLRKSTTEVVFIVLCWFYYTWYGRQFYTSPLT